MASFWDKILGREDKEDDYSALPQWSQDAISQTKMQKAQAEIDARAPRTESWDWNKSISSPSPTPAPVVASPSVPSTSSADDLVAKKAQIQAMYQLSETPEEKARLSWMLANLRNQESGARSAIGTAFNRAGEAANQGAANARAAGTEQSAAMQKLYSDASAAVNTANQSRTQGLGQGQAGALGVGSGGPLKGEAADVATNLTAAGARSSELAGQMANLTANDLSYLAQTGSQQSAAQQGALQRAVAAAVAQTALQHDAQVNDRVTSEREQLRAALTDADNNSPDAIYQRAVAEYGAKAAAQQAVAGNPSDKVSRVQSMQSNFVPRDSKNKVTYTDENGKAKSKKASDVYKDATVVGAVSNVETALQQLPYATDQADAAAGWNKLVGSLTPAQKSALTALGYPTDVFDALQRAGW